MVSILQKKAENFHIKKKINKNYLFKTIIKINSYKISNILSKNIFQF